MRTVEWMIPSYNCSNCLHKIKTVLAEIEGVAILRTDQSQHRLTVEGRSPEALAYAKRRLAEAGYPAQPVISPTKR